MTTASTPMTAIASMSVADALRRPLNRAEAKNAPSALFGAGRWELLSMAPTVSIVGTRAASPQGIARATVLAMAMAHQRVTVMSGITDGIDTAAHTATIRAGGETVGVIGTTLDQCYPPKNRALQTELMRDYLVVTQFRADTKLNLSNCARSNRTVALLSDATIIVEAQDGSGSLHHAWEALRLSRPLFVFDSAVANRRLHWPRELLDHGATVLQDDDVRPVLAALPLAPVGC